MIKTYNLEKVAALSVKHHPKKVFYDSFFPRVFAVSFQPFLGGQSIAYVHDWKVASEAFEYLDDLVLLVSLKIFFLDSSVFPGMKAIWVSQASYEFHHLNKKNNH